MNPCLRAHKSSYGLSVNPAAVGNSQCGLEGRSVVLVLHSTSENVSEITNPLIVFEISFPEQNSGNAVAPLFDGQQM